MTDPRRRRLCQALLCVLPQPWLAAPAAHAAQVTDDRGRQLSFAQTPKRIATISYFGADTVLALGSKPIASTFLARGRPPAYLQERLSGVRDLGQRASPNLELLARAQPDLIIAIRRYTEANAVRLQQIAPYLALNLETAEDSDRSIALVGTALDQAAKARSLNRQFARLRDTYRARVPAGRTCRYLFIWGSGLAPWAFYDESMTCSLLNALGGINVAGHNPLVNQPDNTAFQMSIEAMLLADPDILLVYDDGPARASETNPIWSHLRAARTGRIVRVGDHWIESLGPIARQAVLAEGAHHLYPDRFAPPDARAITDSFFG